MSNGSKEKLNEEVTINVTAPVEELQESHDEESTRENLVNCIKISITERSNYHDDGEYSGHSSAATTPLERSQEISHLQEDSTAGSPQTKDFQLFKEWNSLINLFARIPVKAQKGLSVFDLKLTCISTIEEFLVIGTNVGIVYWYNRRTDCLDRLKCEGQMSPITALCCTSAVDYMIAAGNQAGLVTIFQIPRDPSLDNAGGDVPPEFQFEKRTKKSYLCDLHVRSSITALEWSRNGMKLFSGDQTGNVVLTDVDFDLVQIRSYILLCEDYEIVQLSYARKNLLICSTFRSIIYYLDTKNCNQVGESERKIKGKFGGLIMSSAWEESQVYSVRPGARLWVAKLNGDVMHTIKFKELMLSEDLPEIHVIKPIKTVRQVQPDIQFNRVFRFMRDYLVTYYKDVLHIVDARNTLVLGICKELHSILDVAVNKDEIFILESSRNVIRLSAKPDKFSSLNSFNSSGSFSANLFNFPSPSSGLTNSSSNSSSFHRNDPSTSPTPIDFSAGIKQIPDIMSASIADFRFPHEPINFLTSKLKETSGKVIPKINPLINSFKTVMEADVDIEDGQKLLETGLPPPIIPLEAGDLPALDLFLSSPSAPEEPVFVPEPERFQKISTLPFEDVIVDVKPVRKTKKGSKGHGRKDASSKAESLVSSDVTSDSISVSSNYSNTSGSENNISTGKVGGPPSGVSSSVSSNSERKFSYISDATLSSSNSGSEGIPSSEQQFNNLQAKDRLGIPLSMSQSWSAGTLVPSSKTVTLEELHLKEELLAKRLNWPELMPESASQEALFDDSITTAVTYSKDENHWQVSFSQNSSSSDRASNLTLVESNHTHRDGSGDENTDTDSKTLSMEHGSSIVTVIERPVGTVREESDDMDAEDKYYMDIYTRYRSKDSMGSYTSALSFGPPSGSSYIGSGPAGFGGLVNNANHLNGNIDNESPVTAHRHNSITQVDDNRPTDVTATAIYSPSPEELDSIVESKVVIDEYWKRWRLPGTVTQVSMCDHYISCVGPKGTVYYADLNSLTLHGRWRTTNYSASAISVSPCGTVVWRIYRGDLYSLTNSIGPGGPIGQDSEEWSKLTQKKDVANVTVQRSFGWIVKCDGTLEFCTGLLETRLVPHFEKVYTPWPIQEVSCCGHKLWVLTSDGRIAFRTGTSDLNPKGMDWVELKWSSNDVPPVSSISCGEIRDDGIATVWFSDVNANLYFTFDECDSSSSKGAWVAWKVSVSNSFSELQSSSEQPKSVLLSSIKQQVSRSFKSLVHQGTKGGVKLCSSKHSVWVVPLGSALIFGNRNTITGHYWKPVRVDRGITVPPTWTNIYANSVYKGHGNLWILDSKGNLFHMPPAGGKLQQLDLPMPSVAQVTTIASAPESLWVLTSTGDIHGRCSITSTNSTGKDWRQINLSTLKSTHFVHISCGSEVAWAVDDLGEIYMSIGSLRPPGAQDMSPAWNKVETSVCCKGVFTKVYVSGNDRMVWAVDNERRVYVRQAVFPDYPIGAGWLLVKGVDAVMLSISDSAVWVLNAAGEIYRRYGITENNFVGDYWRKIPGTAAAITVSLCDELWAMTSEGFLLKHSKKTVELQGWDRINANLLEEGKEALSNKIVLDEEDEDWELVDNSEI